MRQTVQDRANDRANALRSHVLCALFAIMALCATPLGTGALIADDSHVSEQKYREVRDGDLPPRFAVPGGQSQLVETFERVGYAILAASFLDDGPVAIAHARSFNAGEIGTVTQCLLVPEVRAGLQTCFEARAPPRA